MSKIFYKGLLSCKWGKKLASDTIDPVFTLRSLYVVMPFWLSKSETAALYALWLPLTQQIMLQTHSHFEITSFLPGLDNIWSQNLSSSSNESDLSFQVPNKLFSQWSGSFCHPLPIYFLKNMENSNLWHHSSSWKLDLIWNFQRLRKLGVKTECRDSQITHIHTHHKCDFCSNPEWKGLFLHLYI